MHVYAEQLLNLREALDDRKTSEIASLFPLSRAHTRPNVDMQREGERARADICVCVSERRFRPTMIVLMSTDKDFPPEHSGSADYDTYVCDSVVYISLFVHYVCLSVPLSLSLYPYLFVSARCLFSGNSGESEGISGGKAAARSAYTIPRVSSLLAAWRVV